MIKKNRNKLNIILFCTLLILCSQIVFGAKGHIKILALSEAGNEKKGVSADLFLEIRSGTGRVFLETYPLSQIATQVSMRFAQQIACQELDIDCSVYDFFFTVKAPPGVLGGPSAGAAAAVLTGVVLKDLNVEKSIAITGIINSGGLIGPVGGIPYKVQGAASEKIETVLIPKGTGIQKEGNTTIDVIELGKNLSVDVHEVSTFEEALSFFDGIEKKYENITLTIDKTYQNIMKSVAKDICQRNNMIINAIELNENNSIELKNLSIIAKTEFEEGNFYSAASYCFRSNIAAKRVFFSQKNYTKESLQEYLEKLIENLNAYDKKVNQKPIKSLTDIETYMAVKERIQEARDLMTETVVKLGKNENINSEIAYLEERIYSASAWSKFFDAVDAANYKIDEEKTKQSCANKIAEAEERYSYVSSYVPSLLLESIKKDLDKAYVEWNGKNYIMCLYSASKTKAQINLLLSATGIEKDSLDEIIDIKVKSVQKSLFRAQQKGIFPLLSYYYYQYADTLKDKDQAVALLFLEYSLELSNINIYFEKNHEISKYFRFPKELIYFLIGLIIGGIIFRRRTSIAKDHKIKPKKQDKKHLIKKGKR